jgi:integrase
MAVYKRGGHWHFTKTINGVRYRGAFKTARTKAQAEEAERKKLQEIHEGVYGKPKGSAIFIEFAEKIYLPWSKENKRSTNDQYHIKTFKAFFKRKTFAEISPMLIESFKSERRKGLTKTGKPRSPASVNRELALLSSIFSMAMRKPHRLTAENPCLEVKKIPEENQRSRYLTPEDEIRLLAACVGDREHLRPIILMAVNTGMRRGEILSLRWSQVDFQRGVVHLVRTKSGKGRDVPINLVIREELLKLRQSSSECVFTSQKTGRALTHCKRAFASACRVAGIEDLHFHDLRHTAATRNRDGPFHNSRTAWSLGSAND